MVKLRWPNLHSLRFRLILASTVVEVALLSLLLANSVRLTNDALIASANSAVAQMVPALNVIAATSLVQGDLATLQDNLNEIVGNQELGIVYVVVADRAGHRVSAGRTTGDQLPPPHTDVAAALKEPILHLARPLSLAGQPVGAMQFGLATTRIAEARQDLLRQGVFIAVLEVLLTIAALGAVGFWLTRDLRNFVAGSQAVAEGRYDLRLPEKGRDEVTILAHNFNLMAQAVRERIAAVEASEREYRALFDQAAVGISHTALDGRFIRVNAKFAAILGYSKDELMKLDFREVTHPDDIAITLVAQEAVLQRQRESIEIDKRYLRMDGIFLWARLTIGVVREGDGRPAYFIAVIQDISDAKAAERELAHHRAHLEELVADRTRDLEAAYRELESFSYSVSHDLRAPVRSVGSFAQILADDYNDRLDDEGRDYLRRIERAARRMSQLIDALLELSRFGRVALQKDRVDLSEIAVAIVEELRAADPDPPMQVRIEPGLTTFGDRRLLAAMLQNLLSNAWKFTRGRPDATIEFGCVPGRTPQQFYVRDNGTGFDMAYSDRLFGAFQRLHPPEEFEGTGIGLATVHRIVSRHGGEIWAEAKVGAGATFFFTLSPRHTELPRMPAAAALDR